MGLRIGLTGGIGSGKTLVGEILSELGAVVIDADQLAREVVAPGTPGLAAITQRFGPKVLNPDHSLDRAALAEVVFADQTALADLNAIVHPEVRRRAYELAAAAGDAVVVMMIPLLVETGQQSDFDEIIVVDVPEHLQLRRVMARNGWPLEQVQARIAAQASRAERLAAATQVIDNSGPLTETRRQVEQLWTRLRTG